MDDRRVPHRRARAQEPSLEDAARTERSGGALEGRDRVVPVEDPIEHEPGQSIRDEREPARRIVGEARVAQAVEDRDLAFLGRLGGPQREPLQAEDDRSPSGAVSATNAGRYEPVVLRQAMEFPPPADFAPAARRHEGQLASGGTGAIGAARAEPAVAREERTARRRAPPGCVRPRGPPGRRAENASIIMLPVT